MRKIVLILMMHVLLLSTASAETIRQQVNAPEHLTLEPFQTTTGLSNFMIDAAVEIPDVENVKIYAYNSQYIPEDTVLAFANAIGINIKKVSYDEKYAYANNESNSFIYHKNGHFLAANQSIYDKEYYTGYIQYQKLNNKISYDSLRGQVMYPLDGDCAADTTYPFADAKALACEVVAAFAPQMKLGIYGVADGYQNLTNAQIEKLNDPNYKGIKPKAHVYGGYTFLFYQEVDSIPITITGDAGFDHEFCYFLSSEHLSITVSEGQVVSMRLDANGKLGEVKQESCELLDFASVLEIAKKILPLKYVTREYDEVVSWVYSIDRVVFGYMRVMVAGQPNTFELIPVWDFMGNDVLSIEDKKGNASQSSWYRMDQSLLTINAMTGTVIDRELGY